MDMLFEVGFERLEQDLKREPFLEQHLRENPFWSRNPSWRRMLKGNPFWSRISRNPFRSRIFKEILFGSGF